MISGSPPSTRAHDASTLHWCALWLVHATACVLFVLGLYTPMLSVRKFYFFRNTVSVLSGVQDLVATHNWALLTLIVGFSIVLPLLKLLVFLWLIAARGTAGPATRRLLHWTHEYGRWGMLDVFVVAVLLVSVKLGAVVHMTLHRGVYYFGGAVLLMMVLSLWLDHLYRPIAAAPDQITKRP